MTKGNGKVAVTGSSGFVALHVVRALLNEGYVVHACVRSPKDFMNIETICGKDSTVSPENLIIFEGCDLLVEGSFDKAFEGCDFVMHTASPFEINPGKNPQKTLVEPALLGTTNVLNSVIKNKVKKCVLTASVASVHDVTKPGEYVHSEKDFNDSVTIKSDPYSYSKQVAEQKAWEIAKDADFELATVHPVLVIGENISGRDNGGTFGFLNLVLNGTMIISPCLNLAFVGVTDVAKLHLIAMEKDIPEVIVNDKTNRYIAFNKVLNPKEFADLIRVKWSKKYPRLPKVLLYNWIAKLLAPLLGLKAAAIGKPFHVDNSKSKENGLEYEPLIQSVDEMIESIQKKK